MLRDAALFLHCWAVYIDIILDLGGWSRESLVGERWALYTMMGMVW